MEILGVVFAIAVAIIGMFVFLVGSAPQSKYLGAVMFGSAVAYGGKCWKRSREDE